MIDNDYRPGLSEMLNFKAEKYPVFGGVIEMRKGYGVGEEIERKILSGDIRRVVFLGEPGNGKTTLMTEVQSAVGSHGNISGRISEFQTHLYDDYLAREQKIKKKSSQIWTPEEWTDFNIHMHRKIQKDKNDDAVQFIEIPGVGYVRLKNRGITNRNMLAEDSNNAGNDTLFIFLVRNRAIQKKAAYIRSYVQDLRDEEVVSFLHENNVFFKGVDDTARGGARIKKLMKKMGQKIHIDDIRGEELTNAAEWSERDVSEIHRRKTGMVSFPLTPPEEIYELMMRLGFDFAQSRQMAEQQSHEYIHEAEDQAIYMEHVFEEELGVPRENVYILNNRFISGPTVIDLTQIRRHKVV